MFVILKQTPTKQLETKTPTKPGAKDIKKEFKVKKSIATSPEKEKALLDQKPESGTKEEKGKACMRDRKKWLQNLHREYNLLIYFLHFEATFYERKTSLWNPIKNGIFLFLDAAENVPDIVEKSVIAELDIEEITEPKDMASSETAEESQPVSETATSPEPEDKPETPSPKPGTPEPTGELTPSSAPGTPEKMSTRSVSPKPGTPEKVAMRALSPKPSTPEKLATRAVSPKPGTPEPPSVRAASPKASTPSSAGKSKKELELEEYKNKLAEKRRQAREKAEREAELERQRQEELR